MEAETNSAEQLRPAPCLAAGRGELVSPAPAVAAFTRRPARPALGQQADTAGRIPSAGGWLIAVLPQRHGWSLRGLRGRSCPLQGDPAPPGPGASGAARPTRELAAPASPPCSRQRSRYAQARCSTSVPHRLTSAMFFKKHKTSQLEQARRRRAALPSTSPSPELLPRPPAPRLLSMAR